MHRSIIRNMQVILLVIFSTFVVSVFLVGCKDTGTPIRNDAAEIEEDTIILGSVLSLSGKYSTNGVHTRNGYEIAVSRVNEMGGVNVGGKSYKMKVVYYDDRSTPTRAAQLADRAIRRDGIKFMLGPYSSGLTNAVAPVTEKYKIPMVEAEGAARPLFQRGYRQLFAVLSISHLYLAGAVDLAAKIAERQGRNSSDIKVALAFENDPFSQDVRAGVIDRANHFGMRIVIDDKIPRDLSDISRTLTKVRAVKPDLLVVSGHTKGTATAARQIKEMKIDVPMVAMTHCEAAKIVSRFGDSTNGFLCPTQWTNTLRYSGKYFGSATDYDKFFKKNYKGYRNVPYQTAGASAAVLVWKEAFERANSHDTDKVRDAIAATDMPTYYSRIKFGPEGFNIAKPMVLRQIQGGKLKVVYPTNWAPSPLIYPRQVPK